MVSKTEAGNTRSSSTVSLEPTKQADSSQPDALTGTKLVDSSVIETGKTDSLKLDSLTGTEQEDRLKTG